MRPLAALILGLSLLGLAGPAAGQNGGAGARRVEVTYNAVARGISAGEFSYDFAQNGAAYEITAARRLTGLARALMGGSQDYTYSVAGSVTGAGVLRPRAYQHQGGRRNRLVRASFTGDDIVTTAEPRMGMGDPPATQAQKRGAVDQLTAIASLITASGDPCGRTVRVYMDGRSRFDFVIAASQPINVDSPAYRGPALRCAVEFRPIAGFTDPQEVETLTFLFARTASGLYAPIRIEMPSDDVGVIRLEARRISINGERLR